MTPPDLYMAHGFLAHPGVIVSEERPPLDLGLTGTCGKDLEPTEREASAKIPGGQNTEPSRSGRLNIQG
jgi:hypothetical protein